MNNVIKAIGVLLLTILLQIVIFRFGVFANGKAMIFFHLYGLVLLPIGWHKTSYLFVGAFTGFMILISYRWASHGYRHIHGIVSTTYQSAIAQEMDQKLTSFVL